MQKCGTTRIALNVVLLDQVSKQGLEAGPITLLVALCQLAHNVLVLLNALHHSQKFFLVFSQPDKQLHGCTVFQKALNRLPGHGQLLIASLCDNSCNHAQVDGSFLPLL